MFGSVISNYISETFLKGVNYFYNNWSGRFGVISLSFSNMTFEDHVIVCNNTAVYRGGAIFSIASAINFQQGAVSLFENNKAEDGGAIYTVDGTISLKE